MDHKLSLLAYVLHPARHLQHINKDLETAHSSNIATYAEELYERLLGGSAEDHSAVFKQTALYLGRQGAFKNIIPKYVDTKEDPSIFWSLMAQTTPHLAQLATHLSQVAVNSAAVERLFSSFLHIQTTRRHRLVHERVQKIAAIKAMLPAKPRSASKPAADQYLGAKPVTRAAKLTGQGAARQLADATADTKQQFVDGAEDMLVDAQQVDEAPASYWQQVNDDEADDAEYSAGTDSCVLAELFVDMPAFDLNLLFEDEIDPEAS